MGFFLLGRQGDEVGLIAPALFPTRHEALSELTRLSARPDSFTAEEVFVVDLDVATPVVLITRTALADPVSADEAFESESAAVWEAPATDMHETEPEDSVLDEGVAAQAVDETVPQDETLSEAPAQPSLEPDVGAQPLPEPETVPEPPPEPAADPERTPDSWPWDLPERDPDIEPEPDSPHPSAAVTETEPVAELEAAADSAIDQPSEPDGTDSVDDADEPASLTDEDDTPPQPPKVYEAGSSDLDELTCDDCVYLNTCPKQGESDPTSCGSFQWKSV